MNLNNNLRMLMKSKKLYNKERAKRNAKQDSN